MQKSIKKNIIVFLCLIFVFSLFLFVINQKPLVNATELTGEENDGIIEDTKWDEKLFVNHDMAIAENNAKNAVIAGNGQTNQVVNKNLLFIEDINNKNGVHNRGTTPLNEENAIVYLFKKPIIFDDYSHFSITFYSENPIELSFYSSKQKNLTKENSLLKATITNSTNLVLPFEMFEENGKINSITVVVDKISLSTPLYLDDITLKASGIFVAGGSVRLNNPSGLGFGSEINKQYYDKLESQFGSSNVKTGTLVTKRDFLTDANELNATCENILNIVNRGWIREDNQNYTYRGSITNIPEKHYQSKFVGRGYIKVTANNTPYYIYTAPCVRTISEVAYKAYHDENANYTNEQLKILTSYCGGAVVENNQINHKIVIPQNATVTETTSAQLLSEKMAKATGLEMPQIVTEGSEFVERGIYIGATSKAPENIKIPKDDEGHIIAKDEKGNIYIKGHSSKTPQYKFVYDRGTVYGVYDFLERYFGYRFLNVDYKTNELVETFDNVTNLGLMDIKNEEISPSIPIRAYSAYNIDFANTVQPYASMMRHNTNLAKSGGGFDYNSEKYGYTHQFEYYAPPFHNSYDTLLKGIEYFNEQNPGYNLTADEFSYTLKGVNKPEVCMTKSVTRNGRTITSLELVTLALKEKISSSYQWTAPNHYYVYEQEDSHDNEECTCANCVKEREKYGGASGQLINFMNNVIANLKADSQFIANCPDFKIITFAYMYTNQPPTNKNVKCDEHLIIRLALRENDFYGFNQAENQKTSKLLSDWKQHLGGGIMFWIYDSDFQNYAGYFPTINRSIADNVKAVLDSNGKYLLVNASGAKNDWDSELRLYVYSRLMYNFDEARYNKNAELYVREIANEYIKGYFGANNANGINEIITKYQAMYDKKGGISPLKDGFNGRIDKTSLKGELQALKPIIDNLIANESNQTYLSRLKLVKISILADLYDAGETGFTKKRELKELCKECSFTEWSEGLTVDQKLK